MLVTFSVHCIVSLFYCVFFLSAVPYQSSTYSTNLCYSVKLNPLSVVFSGGEKLEFTPASSQLLFTPASVETVVDSG